MNTQEVKFIPGDIVVIGKTFDGIWDGCSGTVYQYSGEYPCVRFPGGDGLAFMESELISTQYKSLTI